MAEPVSNEVLASQLVNLSSQVNKLEVKLDAYATHFVTGEVYELKHKELELRTETLSTKIDAYIKTASAKLWIASTFSAAGGIILAFLVQFYLSHQGH